jgi:predicted nucleic-acid-binding Zn-ribbon protein
MRGLGFWRSSQSLRSREMEKFDENSHCPKCGDVQEPKVQFEFGGGHMEGGKLTTLPDRLIVTCRRCGYSYAAKCLDEKS